MRLRGMLNGVQVMWMFWIENGERGYRCKQCERFVPLEDFLINNKGPCECYKARSQVRQAREELKSTVPGHPPCNNEAK